MITAQEAKELSDMVNKNIPKYTTKIDSKIKSSAKRGKYYVCLTFDVFDCDEALASLYRELGYDVSINTDMRTDKTDITLSWKG